MDTSNAVIEDTMLGFEDHGFLTFFLHLDYGGSGQGAGGIILSGAYTDHYIREILKTVGVEKWEQLKGKHVRAKHEHWRVFAIGHIIKDQWMEIGDWEPEE